MDEHNQKPMNIYPTINFIHYFWQLFKKHNLWIVGSGVLLGAGLCLLSYIQIYSSSTIFRFQVSETRSTSLIPTIQLEGIMGKTENVRDKSFSYMHSIPFYFELARRFSLDAEGRKILPIFKRSRGNLLLRVKSFFFDTFTYGATSDQSLQLAQSLQKVFSFKKDSDNTIIMYVRSGKPSLSIKLGEIVGPIVRSIILDNESFDVKVSAEHFNELLKDSQNNLQELEKEMVTHKQIQQNEKGNLGNAPIASMELEKELRMAKIEAQRLALLTKNLQKQISENSMYALGDGQYKYVDQVSIERLNELKQQLEIANAKVVTIERSFTNMKQDNLHLPASEQNYMKLKWQHELEHAINKDLLIKTRDIEGLSKLLDNSVRVIGETALVPAKLAISRPMRFIFGFLLGTIFAMISVYYYFDFFKIIQGNHDIRNFGNFEILTSMPEIKKIKANDIWKDLPANHHAMEAFRHMMEKAEVAKVVSFVSPGKGEGKSYLIANLAQNLSRFGKRVGVVDTNWVNPTLSRTLAQVDNIKVVNAENFLHDKDSFMDRSLLIKQIKKLSYETDIILIDTQSLSTSNDAMVVASVCNLNIIVCSYFETFQHKYSSVMKRFDVAGISNYSVVLNKATMSNEFLFFKGRIRALDEIDTNPIYMKKSS